MVERSQPISKIPAPPWRVGYSDGSGTGEDGGYSITVDDECVVRSGDIFGLVYGIQSERVANLIVHAVNSHEALKARIQDLEEALRELMDQPTENPLRLSPPQLEALWAAHNRARSALQPKDAE